MLPHLPNSQKLGRGASLLGLALATALAAMPARAADPAGTPGLVLSNQWFRAVTSKLPEAGYFDLTNNSGKATRLVGAFSPACGTLMLHQTISLNGVDRMVMVRSLELPAHGALHFAPGGYHLMCVSPTPDAKPGHSVSVTLRFADGATLEASFPVHGATGK
jgi:periplasmic copper chaperone A